MDYKQLQDLKNQYKDCILFVRVGDFYEAFGEDAAVLSKELDLTLTGRDMANAAERVPMAGVPFHAVERYIARLIENGHKVAVAENMGESVSIKKPEIRERDADEEEEDYFDGWAKDVIRSGLKGVRNDNRADYLRARLIAANAFSGIINRDMSYFDASIVDPVSNRLYSEKALIKSMLSEISGAEDKAVQALYLKEIAERFSREISDDILEAYGWDRDNLYKNILEKSVTAPVRTVAENTDNTAAPKTVAAEASGGLTIKSQVEGLADWSTESLPQEARVAAEWLIRNGYENENDVKSAFYYRQTSDMSDYRYAKRNDDDAIASLAESYKKRAADARKAAIVRPSEGLRETRQQTTSQNQKTKNVGNDDALNGTAETKIKNVREDKKMNDGKIKNYEDDYPFFENGVSYENANAGKESHRLTPEDYIKQADADFIAAMREGRYPEIVNGIADLNYSLRNVMLIKSQMPEATKVMGMHAWNYQGRSVIGGQKSLKILAVSDGNEAGEYGEENRGGNTSGKSYRLSYVFDVSQTKGKALKDKACTPEVLDKYFDGIRRTIAGMAQGYVFIEHDKSGVNFDERVISIPKGLSREEQLKAMIHGVARVRAEGRQRESGEEMPRGRGLFNAIEETAVTHIAARRLGLGSYPSKTADFEKFDDDTLMRLSSNLHHIKMGAQRVTNAVERYISQAQSADAMRAARADAAETPVTSTETRAAIPADVRSQAAAQRRAGEPAVVYVPGYYPIFNGNVPVAAKSEAEAGG